MLWEVRFIKMMLCVTTCDKCGEPMKKGQDIVTIGLSTVTSEESLMATQRLSPVTSGDNLIATPEPEIRYACHLDCWDGVEVDY
jgi:hypothetical protein